MCYKTGHFYLLLTAWPLTEEYMGAVVDEGVAIAIVIIDQFPVQYLFD